MSTQYLAPLPMSQTKDELLKYLNMSLDTYAMMAKEADAVYKDLTSDKRHLKDNCKRKPPYDWSDILELSKDAAMRTIAQSGNARTNYYWRLASETMDCPNWIARWFLYHKFRYRDGRNRNPTKGVARKQPHHGDSKHHRHTEDDKTYGGYCDTSFDSGSMVYGQTYQTYDSASQGGSGSMSSYSSYGNHQLPEVEAYKCVGLEGGSGSASLPYDPVRDSH